MSLRSDADPMKASSRIAPEIDAQIRSEVEKLRENAKSREQMSKAVASMLFFRFGLYPSVATVHGFTRWGSVTDINKDIDAFWDELRRTGRLRLEGSGVPDELAQEAGRLLGRMFEISNQHAHDGFEEFRIECRKDVETANEQARLAEIARQASVEAVAQMQAKLERALLAQHEAETQLAVVSANLDQAKLETAQWQKQAEQERGARLRAEEQFSRDLEAQKQQREASEERLNGEIKFAKLQIEEARAHGRDLRERNARLEADSSLLITQLRQQVNGLRDELGQARMLLGEATGENKAVSAERDRLVQELRELRQKLEARATDVTQEQLDARLAQMRADLINYPNAFEVKEALSLYLEAEVQCALGPNREPLYWLGGAQYDNGVITEATPRFASLALLEAFCQVNVDRYTDLESMGTLPSKWFWQ